MKKIILYLLSLIFIGSFCFSTITISSSQNAIHLWLNTLVPSFLFPLILVRLLAPYHLLLPLLRPLKKLIWKCFHMNSLAFEYVLTSLFLGFPSASLFLEDFSKQEKLSQKEYNRLLYCTFLTSPNFLLISLRSVYSQEVVLKLFTIQILCVFFLLLFTRNIPLTFHFKTIRPSFYEQLSTSIERSFQILLIILAYLLLVYVVIDIVTLPLNAYTKIPLKLLSEFSSGCFYIHELSFSFEMKMLLTSFLLSYGGLCVHIQLISSLSKKQFHYMSFMKYRCCHILLGLLLTWLFFMA